MFRAQPLARACAFTFLLTACGSDGSDPGGGGGGGGDTEPTETAVGAPSGAAASQSIGPAGGTLASTDGVVSLTIPAGALSAATTLTIQPIAAMAPGATGTAYRLGPDGTQFATPVSLTFTYTDEQMIGSAPEVSWIAYQEAGGAWRYVDDLDLDTTARTLTAQITHFSDWTHVLGLQLRPPSAEVDPNGSVDLEVKDCMTEFEGPIYAFDCVSFDFGDDDLPALPSRNNPRGSVDAGSWAVNGDPGGSGLLGLIEGTDVGGEFRAPTQAPEEGNPVAVSVDILDGSNRKVATLVSNIRIRGLLPAIHVVGGLDTTNIGIAVLVGADVTDKVEFDMELKPDGSIAFTNVRNFPSVYTNAHLPPEANTICNYTLDSPFEFGTYTEFTGGNTSLDSVIVSMSGEQQLAASTYYVPVEGACTGALSYPGQTGSTVAVLFEFDPAMLDHVGADVVVVGTGPNYEWNGWVFSLRRTR